MVVIYVIVTMSLTPEEKQRIEEEELLRAEIRKKIEAKEKAGK